MLKLYFLCSFCALATGCSTTPQVYRIKDQEARGSWQGARLIAASGNATISAHMTDVDQVPRLVKTVAPVMPPEAIDADLIGDVTVELLVSTEGRVISAKVLSSPHAVLSAAVVKAMHQWVFSPLVEGGKPRQFVIRQTYAFQTEP